MLGRDGVDHSGAASLSADGLVVTATVSGLVRGSWYTVRWRATGADGHFRPASTTSASGSPAATHGGRGRERDDVEGRSRPLGAVRRTRGRHRPARRAGRHPPGRRASAVERRFHLVPTVAAFAVIDVGIVVFLVRASNALQLPSATSYGDLQPFAENTRFGVAFLVMTVGFAVVAALLSLPALDRLELRLPALALSCSSCPASPSRAIRRRSRTRVELGARGLAPLVAACVWVGGLVTLAFLVRPVAPAVRRQAFLGFSRLAVVLVSVMVLAGAYLALVRLPEASDLWETGYGRLCSSSSESPPSLAWGGIHHSSFARGSWPATIRACAPASSGRPPSP